MAGLQKLKQNACNYTWAVGFQELGYARLGKVVDAGTFNRLRSGLMDMEKYVTPENQEELFSNRHHDLEFIQDYVLHPNNMHLISQFLGNRFKIFSSVYIPKFGDFNSETPWHQDGFSWQYLSKPDVFSLWLALDDIDADNGALEFLLGETKIREPEQQPANGFSPQLTYQYPARFVDQRKVILNNLSRGETSLHTHLTPHRSQMNRSDRPRRGFVVRYVAEDAYFTQVDPRRKKSAWTLDENYKFFHVDSEKSRPAKSIHDLHYPVQFNNEKRRVAFIGTGGVGCVHAAHCANQGLDTTLIDYKPCLLESIEVRERGSDELLLKEKVRVECDISAVEDSDAIVLCVPTHKQREVMSSMLPYLRDSQEILLLPGHTFGALEAATFLRKNGLDLTVSEVSTSIFAALRKREEEATTFLVTKKNVKFATFPSIRTDHAFSFWGDLLRQAELKVVPNVLYTSLSNFNCVVHPITCLLNLSRIEHGEEWLFYKQGVENGVDLILQNLTEEVLALRKALDVEDDETLVDFMNCHYRTNVKSFHEFAGTYPVHKEIKGPKTINHRFLIEDIATGVIPLVSLGKTLGVNVSTFEAIETLARIAHPEAQFDEISRSLPFMGLENLTPLQLQNLVTSGSYN